MNQPKNAMIAMSGGVDSSVAAHLMLSQGTDCIGATMQLNGDENWADAAAVADRLGIPFQLIDGQNAFKKYVQEHFVRSYESGLTPNPCIECNKHLKFGLLLEKALEMGCDTVVTGHYAKISHSNGRYYLSKAADLPKDQTYFLYGLTQHQLAHSCFPLGSLTKEQVRRIAAEEGFLNAKKRDSQDICFVPNGDFMDFIRQFTKKTYTQGDYLDLEGNTVGRHNGAIAYTLGQRKGLGIALGAPVYVCAKDMENNTVTVGPNEALFSRSLLADDWNWMRIPGIHEPLRASAKARSRMTEQPATVYPEENGMIRVVFDEPQRAITPGQAVVLYDGDDVIGGGTIRTVLD